MVTPFMGFPLSSALHVCMYMYVCTCTYMYVCICMCVYVYMYVLYVLMCVWMYTYVGVVVFVVVVLIWWCCWILVSRIICNLHKPRVTRVTLIVCWQPASPWWRCLPHCYTFFSLCIFLGEWPMIVSSFVLSGYVICCVDPPSQSGTSSHILI